MPPWPGGRPSSWRTGSANHLVRQEEERWGYGDAEGLGGLEVEDQLELCGLLHRQVGGLGAFQELVHVGGGASPQVKHVWSIRHETASLHPRPRTVYRWQAMLGREVHNALPVKGVKIALQHDHGLRTLAERGG